MSYSDLDQNHKGVIYQATNWFYIGCSMMNKKDSSFIINNKRVHGRNISDIVKKNGGLKGLTRLQFVKSIDENCVEYITKGKHKYIYPLSKSLFQYCKDMSKPYPKNT